MTPAEIKQYNMNYLDLTETQYDLHCRIMNTPMRRWYPELYTYCETQSKLYGFCGDAVACWVAEWIQENWERGEYTGEVSITHAPTFTLVGSDKEKE